MRSWFVFLFIVLFSFYSKADIVCLGKTSCQLLNDISKQSNFSLNQVLNEIDLNLIIPIIQQQNLTSTRDFSRISFSLKGVEENYRLGFNIGGVSNFEIINSNILGVNFENNYYYGGTKPTFFIEIPNNSQFNTIINITKWNGPIDYYTGLSDVKTNINETSFSISERYFLFKKNYYDLSIITGFSFGNRQIILNQQGSKVSLITNSGYIYWSGEEQFKQNSTFIGIPNYLIGSIKLFDFIISGIFQYNFVYTNSIYEITKFGPIGPFLGQNIRLNTGIFSENEMKKWNLFPDYGASIEYEILNVFINGFYQKSANNIDKFSIGIGCQF